MCMDEWHRSDVMYELLDAGALIVGSSTLNNQMLPQMADVLTYIRGLKPANLVGQAFGSFGWSGEAVGKIREVLEGMNVELVGEAISVKHVPGADILSKCYALGTLIAERLHDSVGVQ